MNQTHLCYESDNGNAYEKRTTLQSTRGMASF